MFEWDAHNINHLWIRHGLQPNEAEEVLFDHEQVPRHPVIVKDELRVTIIGHTAEGRILIVVITSRAGLIRILSAYPANGRRLRDYRRGRR